MKKLFALLLALVMVVGLFAACGKDEGKKSSAGADGNDGGSKVKGEMFDAGNVQALAPKGWKAFPVTDPFAEVEGATDPNSLTIVKDAKTDLDLFANPYVRIDYYGIDEEMMGGLKEFYDNTEDLEPITVGGHTWEGFTTTDYGLMAVLTCVEGELEYQASIYLEATTGSISLEDADVLAILESVASTETAQ